MMREREREKKVCVNMICTCAHLELTNVLHGKRIIFKEKRNNIFQQ